MAVRIGGSGLAEVARRFAAAKTAEARKTPLTALPEQLEEKRREKAANAKDIADLSQLQQRASRPAAQEEQDILQSDAPNIRDFSHSGDPALATAYLANGQAAGKRAGFADVDELTAYLEKKYNVVAGGMTSISGRFLQKCLTDGESQKKLFDTLQAAEEAYAKHKDKVGFQGMQVTIDENGEATTTSSKATVAVNEGKRRRQIAAAATQKDMQAVLAMLEKDLQEVENGLTQNMCDEAEVAKVKALIEAAKERMGTLPDRAPTPEEQSMMSVNMLI